MTIVSTTIHSDEERNEACEVEDQRRRRSNAGAMNNSKSKKKPTSLPQETAEYLKNWIMSPEHIAHPYPTEQEKAEIMKDTGIELKQLTNWFVNNRKRYWKPRVEARLQQQAKAQCTPSTVPTSVSVRNSKNRVVVTPNRRSSGLVHVVSTSNLANLNMHRTPLGEDGGNCALINESSCSSASSDSESDGHDDVSTSQASDEPIVTKRTANVFVESASPPRDDGSSTAISPPHYTDQTPVETAHNTPRTVLSEKVSLRIVLFQRDDNRKSYLTLGGNHFQNDDMFDTIADSVKGTLLDMFNERWENPSKRKAAGVADIGAPRPKYRRKSLEVWKRACEEANHGYCTTLPTLDEAARLFGFA